MSFTETTRTSWFSRLKNGLAGIIIGPILIIGMIWLLSWNEGRSVQTYRALAEGAGLVVSLDNGTIDPANDGKLVHIAGPVNPEGTPRDTTFDVSAEGAAGVQRDIDMYQWVEDKNSETRKTLGGGEETVTTYSYKKEWRRSRVDSSDFRTIEGHENPDMPVESDRFAVASAKIGAFTVDGDAVAALGKDSPIRTTPDMIGAVKAALGGDRPVKAEGSTIYVSQNRSSPAVGDLRIRFTRQDIAEASFIGAQNGPDITQYRTSNGRMLLLSAAGRQTPDEMFASARSENALITWLVRAGGLIGMFIGFAAMLSLLGIIADVIPVIGSIVTFGTSAIALILTMILGPLVIAIAWIAYRPFLAIAIIAAGAAIAAGIVYMRRNRTAPATARA